MHFCGEPVKSLVSRASENASVLPNILFARTDEALPYEPTQPENKTVMVIGSYDYEPNIEGVDWLVEKVWAGVHDAIPQARLKIYGSNMSEALRARWGRVAGWMQLVL
jgi:hypothetical protein